MICYSDRRSRRSFYDVLHPNLHAPSRIRCEICLSAAIRGKAWSQRFNGFIGDGSCLATFGGNDPHAAASFELRDAIHECDLFPSSHPYRVAHEGSRKSSDRKVAIGSRVRIEQNNGAVRGTARWIRRPEARERDKATVRRPCRMAFVGVGLRKLSQLTQGNRIKIEQP